MWNFLKNAMMFRLSQRTANRLARSFGAGAKLAAVIGLAAGVRQWRRQTSAQQ